MEKIILFYQYSCIENPHKLLEDQKKLCQSLGLKGRVIIAQEGINGTLGGTPDAIEHYKKSMRENSLFSSIDFKESESEHSRFPRLRIVVKNEIVNTGLPADVAPAQSGGIHLDPAQAHALLAQKKSDLVVIDCRNPYESAIGTIPGAIRPDVKHFRDFPLYVETHAEEFQNKEVLMYCTGGVRCERASAYVKLKSNAKAVYQIKGGIHRYVEEFPNGFFRGKNYVFDGRIAVKVTDDILGTCYLCNSPCDDYTNCLRAICNRHFICCTSCLASYQNTCSAECREIVSTGTEHKRPALQKQYTNS